MSYLTVAWFFFSFILVLYFLKEEFSKVEYARYACYWVMFVVLWAFSASLIHIGTSAEWHVDLIGFVKAIYNTLGVLLASSVALFLSMVVFFQWKKL